MTYPTESQQLLLRYALRANAAFSGCAACIMLVGNRPLKDFLGLPPRDNSLFILPAVLATFAFWLLLNARRSQIRIGEARIAVYLDLAWVALSVPAVLSTGLTSGGKWIVSVVSEIVLVFAIAQWQGIRKIVRASGTDARDA
jgi:hypothetical protein